MRSRLTGRDGDDLWDRLVEAPAPGSTPEALRRAALLTGWALRYEAEATGGVDGGDLVREDCMRAHVAEALASGRRPAVVVGAFHTPALLPSAAGAAGHPPHPPRGGRPRPPHHGSRTEAAGRPEPGRRRRARSP
ncbi:DUF5682 family protein [Streptomyces sp. SL203]|nr:DUF5682 family protein [Streptomyces sp. SL203]MCY1650029.1 DUF5682 family protein [Streptomyces sp. SL203]